MCNHPFLIRGVEDRVISPTAPPPEYFKTFVQASGKFVLLDKLLPKLQAQGHKVLIFSQVRRFYLSFFYSLLLSLIWTHLLCFLACAYV